MEEILVDKKCFLLDALKDKSLISIYFTQDKLDYYTNENLIKLRDEYELSKSLKEKHDNSKIRTLLSLKNKIKSVNNITLNDKEYVEACASKILDFNDKLMCALYLKLITREEAINRKFNPNYIDSLIKEANDIVNDPYIHYYYDSISNQVYVKDEDGNLKITEVPQEIIDSDMPNLETVNMLEKQYLKNLIRR